MRGTAIITLLAIAATATVACTDPEARPEPTKVNVLLVVTDDQRDDLEMMPKTVEWLGEGGVRYPNAFATTPTCCPSRATILSGLYAHNHGVIHNRIPEKLDQNTTVHAALDDEGYYTGVFGKFLNDWPPERDPPHFDDWAITEGKTYFDGTWNFRGELVQVPVYSTTYLARRTTAFLKAAERSDARPWLAIVMPIAPHYPFVAEDKYADAEVPRWRGNPAVFEKDESDKPDYVQAVDVRFAKGTRLRASQLRTLASVDDLMQRLRDRLEELGELRQTLVIFMSDNGLMWGEHGLRGKDVPYTQSVQVPLLASFPAGLEAGTTDRRIVGNVDVAPTILDAAGVAAPWTMDGRSLLDGSWTRDRIHTEHWCNVPSICLYWASTRTSDFQYVEYYGDESLTDIVYREYYDLTVDPWQLDNLLGDDDPSNDPDVAKLGRALRADLACSGTECP